MEDFFLIAKVHSLSKNNGYLNLISFSDFPERFKNLSAVFVDFFGEMKKIIIEDVVLSQSSIVVKFKNFDSAEDCTVLLNKEIFIKASDSIKLPVDNYFIHDLIGCEVFRDLEFIGEITDVLQLPANDVIVVKKDDKEILFPFLKEQFDLIDVKSKKILIKKDSVWYDDEN